MDPMNLNRWMSVASGGITGGLEARAGHCTRSEGGVVGVIQLLESCGDVVLIGRG